MSRIYACKLFKASKRADKIIAALQNPMNLELVKQVSGYLDEEYQQYTKRTKTDTGNEEPLESESADVEDTEDTKDTENKTSINDKSSDNVSTTSHSVSKSANTSTSDDSSSESDSTDEPAAKDTTDDEPVEESTKITASNYSPSVSESINNNLESITTQVGGLLNSKDETKGVSRIMIKDNEMWIHYEDSINLNNVMTQVIMLLSSAGYNYLEFNRLARSENAIVFQIAVSARFSETINDKEA